MDPIWWAAGWVNEDWEGQGGGALGMYHFSTLLVVGRSVPQTSVGCTGEVGATCSCYKSTAQFYALVTRTV